MQHIHTNEKDDITNLKSKFSHPWNIWNDDIDDEIGDVSFNSQYKHIKYWKYGSKNDFIIKSHNTLN